MGAKFINIEGVRSGSGQEVHLTASVKGRANEVIPLQDHSIPATRAMWINPVAQGVGRAERIRLRGLGSRIRSGMTDQTVELSEHAEPAMEASFHNVLSTKVSPHCRHRHRLASVATFSDRPAPFRGRSTT